MFGRDLALSSCSYSPRLLEWGWVGGRRASEDTSERLVVGLPPVS